MKCRQEPAAGNSASPQHPALSQSSQLTGEEGGPSVGPGARHQQTLAANGTSTWREGRARVRNTDSFVCSRHNTGHQRFIINTKG